MSRHYVDCEVFDRVYKRVLDAFSVTFSSDPRWFGGLKPADPEDEADFILGMDIGEFPVLLCTSSGGLKDLIRDLRYEDYLFLLIWPDFSKERIRDKSFQFFEKERRIRKSQRRNGRYEVARR
ncbi:MAG: hypothetical protein AAB582_03665 [Patescibacteria group bacterium]